MSYGGAIWRRSCGVSGVRRVDDYSGQLCSTKPDVRYLRARRRRRWPMVAHSNPVSPTELALDLQHAVLHARPVVRCERCRILSASACHRQVEPSTSVKETSPPKWAAAGQRSHAESPQGYASAWHIGRSGSTLERGLRGAMDGTNRRGAAVQASVASPAERKSSRRRSASGTARCRSTPQGLAGGHAPVCLRRQPTRLPFFELVIDDDAEAERIQQPTGGRRGASCAIPKALPASTTTARSFSSLPRRSAWRALTGLTDWCGPATLPTAT